MSASRFVASSTVGFGTEGVRSRSDDASLELLEVDPFIILLYFVKTSPSSSLAAITLSSYKKMKQI